MPGNDNQKPDAINMLFGESLKQIRKKRRLTSDALAEALDVDVELILSYEEGKKQISTPHLYHLSRILNVSIVDFFNSYDDLISYKDEGSSLH